MSKQTFHTLNRNSDLADLVGLASIVQDQLRQGREDKDNQSRRKARETPEHKDRKRNVPTGAETNPSQAKGSQGQAQANQTAPFWTSAAAETLSATASDPSSPGVFASYHDATAAFRNLSTGSSFSRPSKKRYKMEASGERMKKSSSNTSIQSTNSDMSTSSNPVIELESDDDPVKMEEEEEPIALGKGKSSKRHEPIVVDLTSEGGFSDDDVIVMESPRPFQSNTFPGVHTGVKSEMSDSEHISSDKLAESQKNQGNEHFKKGDYREALSKYNEAIRLNNKEATYFSNRAACHYKMGNYIEALNDAYTCINMDRALARGYERALRAALALGDVKKCDLILNEANSIQLGPEAQKDKANLRLLKENLTCKRNHDGKEQYRESLYYTDKAIEIAIGNACLRMSKVELLFRLSRQEEAVEYYQLNKKSAAGSAEGFYILALCHYYQDNLTASLLSCQQAISLDPDQSKYIKLFKKVKVLHEVREDGKRKYTDNSLVKDCYDHFIKCLELLEELQKLLSSKNVIIESKVLCNLAKLSQKLKNWEEAVSHATKAIEINPKHVKSFGVRGNLYKEKDMFEEAVRDFEAYLKVEPRNAEIKNDLHKTKIALAQSKKKDYYKILGVTRNATEDDVKKAYRALAKAHHPDRHSSASPLEQKKQEKLFKELGQAYAVLSDPAKRRKYDMGGYDENSPGDSFSSAAGFHAAFDPSMFFTQFMNPQGFHTGASGGDYHRGFGAGTSRRHHYQ